MSSDCELLALTEMSVGGPSGASWSVLTLRVGDDHPEVPTELEAEIRNSYSVQGWSTSTLVQLDAEPLAPTACLFADFHASVENWSWFGHFTLDEEIHDFKWFKFDGINITFSPFVFDDVFEDWRVSIVWGDPWKVGRPWGHLSDLKITGGLRRLLHDQANAPLVATKAVWRCALQNKKLNENLFHLLSFQRAYLEKTCVLPTRFTQNQLGNFSSLRDFLFDLKNQRNIIKDERSRLFILAWVPFSLKSKALSYNPKTQTLELFYFFS